MGSILEMVSWIGPKYISLLSFCLVWACIVWHFNIKRWPNALCFERSAGTIWINAETERTMGRMGAGAHAGKEVPPPPPFLFPQQWRPWRLWSQWEISGVTITACQAQNICSLSCLLSLWQSAPLSLVEENRGFALIGWDHGVTMP